MKPELITLAIKQEILNTGKAELNRLISKHTSGEQLSKEDLEYLFISMQGMVGIIQEELLDPQIAELTQNEGPVH